MRIRIDLAYDGRKFRGWARQPGLRTVQGELESALGTVLRVERADTTCAGRTDAGVHARGQVAHLDVPESAGAGVVHHGEGRWEGVRRRLNGVLADDVRVRDVTPAPDGFDARFSALWRRYAYRIADRPGAVDPLARGYVVAWPRPLDLPAMDAAAGGLLGEHDFAPFCRRRDGATTVRRLLELGWTRDERGVATAELRADAFCHQMVRSVVGCLVAVGEGRRPGSWPAEVLAAGERDSAVQVLPAHGLTLEEVRYPPEGELAGRASQARQRRTAAPEAVLGPGGS